KIIKVFGSEIKAIMVGGAFYILMIIFFMAESLALIFVMMFLLCIGMFTVHSIATGMANSMKQSQKALTSGMYLSFYYIGGALGSVVPSVIYGYFGWNILLGVFIFALVLAFMLVYFNRSIFVLEEKS
ncbi:MAG: MFS transporter, partial [Campylobacteraceae bacterium]|nr:MFS transporter [Campylobacteraceae bacterium]